MEPVTLFEEREIEVHFDLGGLRLIPGCTGELGEPIEAFLDLYALAPDATLRIATPADLSRITRAVRSEAEALEFVRLFTARKTHFLFDKHSVLIELVVADAAARGFGVLDPALARRQALPAPRVTAEGEGFAVERCLVRADSPGALRSILLRQERVLRDGGYEFVSDRLLGTLAAEDVALPFYE